MSTDKPLHATASNISFSGANNSLLDLTNSLAYTYLDELYAAGKISSTQLELYKSKYNKLHEIVLSTYNNEKLLLECARSLKTELEGYRLRLEQKTILSHDTVADIELLLNNEKQKKTIIQNVIEEKNAVSFELDELLLSKAEQAEQLKFKFQQSLQQLQPIINNLNTSIANIKQEILEQHSLYEKESNNSIDYQYKGDQINERITWLDQEKIKTRAILQQTQAEPERIKTNIIMIDNVIVEMNNENNKLNASIEEAESSLNSVSEKRRKINQQIEQYGIKLENFRLAIAKRKTNLDDIKRAREIEEQKKDLNAERESNLSNNITSERDSNRAYTVQINELTKLIEQQKKLYEKQRRKKDTITSIQQPLREQIKENLKQFEAMKAQLIQQKQMLNEIKADEELFISQYLTQEKLEGDVIQLLASLQSQQSEYDKKIKLLDKTEKELQLEINSVSASRELMCREASKQTHAYREIKEELKIKNLILIDLDKQTAESFHKLKSGSFKYEQMKNQRNKLANLTQTSLQAIAEIKEKIKILQNEVEILRNETIEKEATLNEAIRLNETKQNERDALRLEQNKYINQLRMKKDEESQQIMQIIKLNSIINNAEKQMINLRKDYATAVDQRNLTGITLIDRNDELCILYEKQNVQNNILKQGDQELKARELEINNLNREINDLTTRIEAARKNIPSLDMYNNTKNTLKQLEKQLEREKNVTEQLCSQLQSTHNNESLDNSATASNDAANRVRRLAGNDGDSDQLASRIELLQGRLNSKREELLERELVLDEVGSLTDKLTMQAAETRSTGLSSAKRVNELQGKLRQMTRKIMAAVSELSMYQANCIKLEEEKNNITNIKATAEENIQQGLPPSADAEFEWIKLCAEKVRRQQLLLSGREHRDELLIDANTVHSTAIIRPNAYLPVDLPIPKPYSSTLAPFKPSSAQVRFYKPPTIKPIQL
jgi:uncharacterized small protein (DUF1192 family)